MSKHIKLTQGKWAIVDDDDYEALSRQKWYAYQKHSGWYASSTSSRPNRRQLHMHRVIMSAKAGELVDHINCDGLDNRKQNLRICSRAENARNSRIYTNNTSGYKGVSKNGPGWRATITVENVQHNLGTYKTKIEAFKAYCLAAEKFHLEFANFGTKGIK